MRLPGTRYQEPGWERVRKLLGSASLAVLQTLDPARLAQEAMLDWYVEAMALALQQTAGSARAQSAGNSYGESALELAQVLVCELRALPSFWHAFVQTLPTLPSDDSARAAAGQAAPAWLRKKINDMYVSLRDRVDADYYQIATGRACSANKIYTWRMLDTAWHEVERLLLDWRNHLPQLSIILGREVQAQPIESRRLKSAVDCDPLWIIRWSESLQQFGKGVGPLHTQSKRFSSLKNNPATIGRMLAEIGEYETLSQNGVDEFQSDEGQFDDWIEDYQRVMQESEQHEARGQSERQAHRVLALDHALARGNALESMLSDGFDDDAESNDFDGQQCKLTAEPGSTNLAMDLPPTLEDGEHSADIEAVDAEQTRMVAALQAQGLLDVPLLPTVPHPACSGSRAGDGGSDAAVSAHAVLLAELALPPDYMQQAAAAEDRDSLMYRALQHETLAVRLALYSKQLGARDDAYPDAWLDPASGELPTMKQLAALDGISLPTLRKRRDLALQRLQAAGSGRNRG